MKRRKSAATDEVLSQALDHEEVPTMGSEETLESSKENVEAILQDSLEKGLLSHYAVFAGITSMKVVLHAFHEDPEDLKKSAKKIVDSWVAEAKRTQYPEFARRKIEILQTFQDTIEESSLDGLFSQALENIRDSIYQSLLEVDHEVMDSLQPK